MSGFPYTSLGKQVQDGVKQMQAGTKQVHEDASARRKQVHEDLHHQESPTPTSHSGGHKYSKADEDPDITACSVARRKYKPVGSSPLGKVNSGRNVTNNKDGKSDADGSRPGMGKKAQSHPVVGSAETTTTAAKDSKSATQIEATSTGIQGFTVTRGIMGVFSTTKEASTNKVASDDSKHDASSERSIGSYFDVFRSRSTAEKIFVEPFQNLIEMARTQSGSDDDDEPAKKKAEAEAKRKSSLQTTVDDGASSAVATETPSNVTRRGRRGDASHKDADARIAAMFGKDGAAMVVLSASLAAVCAATDRADIHIPAFVAASWLVLAFVCGYVLATATARRTYKLIMAREEQERKKQEVDRRKSVLLAKPPPVKEEVPVDLPAGFSTCLLDPKPPSFEVCDLVRERAIKYTSPDGKWHDQICRLRGMDMFLSEHSKEEIWRDKLLNRCGLRDKPTFMINTLFPWGSYLVYFELPPWVKNFDEISESPDDPDDVKALKRFLKGDADYRNTRLYALPVITDAPVAVKMVAPTKKEFKTSVGRAPVSWSCDNERTDVRTGKTSCAILEVAIDCMSSKTIRNFVQFMRRYLEHMTCDAAVIIDKPFTSEEVEPTACIGIFKWDKIDLSSCPVLPPASEEEHVRSGSVYVSQISS